MALQNNFWLMHRLMQSKARLYCGTAYNCPDEIGAFQIAFFGCILLHLRDPLHALGTFAVTALEKTLLIGAGLSSALIYTFLR